jgi:phosphatidylglycerol:prolipoprotein diacylglycerol transferase
MTILFNSINPIALEFGFLKIHWYGIAYFIGILLGILTIKKLDLKYKYFKQPGQTDSFLVFIVLGVLLGGRIGYVLLYNLSYYSSHLSEMIEVWRGGMSFHGALIGLGISSYIFSKKYNVKFFHLTDYISFVAPIGLLLGRLANFVNRELVGRETKWKFAVQFIDENIVRHASQIYEAFGEGLILIILFSFLEWKYKIIKRYGLTTQLFLILYGIIRFTIEFFREPDLQVGFFFGWMTEGQILCILMVLLGIGLHFFINVRGNNNDSLPV